MIQSRSVQRVALVALLALLLIAATACNRDEIPPTPTPPPTQAPAVGVVAATGTTIATEATPSPTPPPVLPSGRITLWHGWAGEEGDALVQVLTAYADAHPGLQIATLFVAPHELPAAYAEAVVAGSGPDLVLMPNWWLADLVAANAVLPLDTLLPDSAVGRSGSGALAAMRHQGALYGLPATLSAPSLYVNTTLLGETVPATSLQELLDQAQSDPALGIGLYANFFHVVWGFPAFGATVLDAEGRVTLDQFSGAADYLSWLNTINATPGSYVSGDYGMLLDRFKKGEFAYFVDGPWALSDLRSSLGDALAVAPLPAGPAGPARPWLYGDGFMLNPAASPAQQQLALDAALYFTGPEAGTLLAQNTSLLPAARAATLGDTLQSGFVTQADSADAMPIGPHMDAVWTYGGDMIVKALTGSAAPVQIVAETTALINDANGK